jgi:Tol biopolymer transport system component
MTPDGKELYFGVSIGARSAIMVTRQEEGVWTEPAVAPFSGHFNDLEPAIAPDGSRFYFLSSRPAPGEDPQPGWTIQDIWVMDREGSGWGEPRNLGAPVNTESGEFFPSLTRDGTLYFTRTEEGGSSAIYRARAQGDGFAEPERLGPEVNHGRDRFNAYVDPDERFLIVPSIGREDNLGGVDYYVVFRSEDDRFSEPVNMGPAVNQPSGREWSASLSPDGKYLFFMSSKTTRADGPELSGLTLDEILALSAEPGNGASGIWWVDASFIEALRPRE